MVCLLDVRGDMDNGTAFQQSFDVCSETRPYEVWPQIHYRQVLFLYPQPIKDKGIFKGNFL